LNLNSDSNLIRLINYSKFQIENTSISKPQVLNLEKKNLTKLFAAALMISLVSTLGLIAIIIPVSAQIEKPLLAITPDFYFAKELGEEFDINVTISNVNESLHLIGIHFRLLYRSDLLQVLRVTEGGFLSQYGATFFAWNLEEDGFYGGPHVVVGNILLPNENGQWPGPFPEGSGVVATIRFKVIYRPVEPNPIEVCVLKFAEVILLDDQGNEIEYTTGISLYQSPVPMQYPKPAFTYSPKYPTAGQAILFDARSSRDPDGQIVTYIWDFGDGATLSTSENTTTHIYNQPRTFNVTLRVVDNHGLNATTSKLVDVSVYTPIEIRIETGGIYYPGEKAEFYISTSQLGKSIGVSFKKIELYYNGSLYEDLSGLAQLVNDGLYLIVYTVPGNAEAGVYMLFVEAEYLNITGIGTASFQISDLLNDIKATLVGIEGTVAYVNSTLGTLTLDVKDINAILVGLSDTLAYVNSTLGTLTVPIENINLTVTEIKMDIATIQTSLGTIQGKVIAIEGNVTKIATIETDLGTVKVDVSNLSGSQGNLTTLIYVVILLALVAAAAAVIGLIKKS
jgi:PKD repeat protein